MNSLKTYKIATVVLAILVVILLVALIMGKKSPEKAAEQALASCQSNIEGWNAKYASSTSPKGQLSAAAKQELSDILKGCSRSAYQTAATL